jgi:hypothetical protein
LGSSDRVGGIWREARTFDIGFQGKMWVATGIMNGVYMNDVWSSTDGVNWVQETASGPFVGRFSSVLQEYGGKLHLIGGTSGPWLNDVWCRVRGKIGRKGRRLYLFAACLRRRRSLTASRVMAGRRLENIADCGFLFCISYTTLFIGLNVKC